MFSPGTILANRYRIDSYLERGDLGDVYLAGDLDNEVPAVVKVLREDLAEDPEFGRQFRRLAPALRALDHPGIARFYAFEQLGSAAFTVAEYIPGMTLRRRLLEAGGPLPLDEANNILDQVAGALAYAHRQDVVHGGVQPGNIVLDGSAALLEDFGIAAAIHNAGMSIPVANPAYMSPEQFQGRDFDAQTDVYSLGAVLYEMVTGQRPFAGESGTGATTRERLEDEHLTLVPLDPREINPALPVAASAVILRALDKRPAARWPDTNALAQAWRVTVPATPAPAAGAVVPAPVPPAAAAHVSAAPATTAAAADAAAAWTSARRLPADTPPVVPAAAAVDAPPRRHWPWALGALAFVALALAALMAWLALGRLGSQNSTAAWAAGNFGPNGSATSGTRTATVTAVTPVPPVPSGAYATARVNANVRSGPGTDYPPVGGLPAGTQVAITGRNPAGDWLQICCINGGPGWILGALLTTAGPTEGVPVVAPPAGQATPAALAAAPTATPTPPPPSATPTLPPPSPTPTLPPPSATPVPATAAPVPTASPTALPPSPAPVAATAPSVPAIEPVVCPQPPGGAFANLPQAGQQALGCPSNGLVETHYSHQFFQHGQMIYRYDLRNIYVLYGDGTWAVYVDTFVEGQPDRQQDLNPPDGMKQPIKGFDRVWERPEVRSKLGWATRDEMGVIPGQAQDFQRGTALWLSHPDYFTKYFVLFADGRWQ